MNNKPKSSKKPITKVVANKARYVRNKAKKTAKPAWNGLMGAFQKFFDLMEKPIPKAKSKKSIKKK